MRISGLFIYPIKGCRGYAVEEAVVEPMGLRYDRRYLIVREENGRFCTQRDLPLMANIVPHAGENGLILSASGQETLLVPYVDDTELSRRVVTVWSFTGEASDCGNTAAEWVSNVMGFACRLVRTPNNFARRVSPELNVPNAPVSFADSAPLLLASRSSLDDLNARLLERGAEPVPIERFRANVIISGAEAWAEDFWHTITISDVRFRVTNLCARCSVTTIDQQTGEKTGPEPLATLATFRRDSRGKVNFAVNLVPEGEGILRVNDLFISTASS